MCLCQNFFIYKGDLQIKTVWRLLLYTFVKLLDPVNKQLYLNLSLNCTPGKFLSFQGTMYSLRKHLIQPFLKFCASHHIFYFDISNNIKIGSFFPYKQEV